MPLSGPVSVKLQVWSSAMSKPLVGGAFVAEGLSPQIARSSRIDFLVVLGLMLAFVNGT